MPRWFSKKRLFQIHGWLGLNLGLLLFVICFSGTCAVFGSELMWLTEPAMRVTPPKDGASPKIEWSELRRTVAEAHPAASILSLSAPPDDRTAARAAITYGPGDYRYVYVDPYTGKVTGQGSTVNIKSFLRIFHKQFYIVPTQAGFHGTLIVGAFGLVLIFSAISGLLFYKRWWRSLWRLRVTRGRRVFWSDLHRLMGVWALLLSILFGLTGVWYFAERIIGSEAGVELTSEAPGIPEEQRRTRGHTLDSLSLDRCVAIAQRAYPELRVTGVRLPRNPDGPLVVQGPAETWLVRERANQVFIDPYEGEVLRVKRGSELPPVERWVHTADPLHFGTFGGTATKIIWFVAGLAICIGILVGAYIWWLRVSQGVGSRKRRPWAAVASSGLLAVGVLTISAYSAFGFIAGQLPRPSDGERAWAEIGRTDIGPWSANVYRLGQPSDGSIAILVRFEPGQHPNFRQARMTVQPDAEGQPVRLIRGAPDQLFGQVSFPHTPAAENSSSVNILIEDWEGERHIEQIRLSDAASKGGAARDLRVPPPPGVTDSATALIALFIILMLVPSAVWLTFIR